MSKKILLFALFVIALSCKAQVVSDDSLDLKYGKNLLKEGVQAPDFSLATADGKQISLSEYRGSYVVLDFWASWCPDCRKDIPAMKELFNEFRSQNVSFVGISFDTDRDAWVDCYWNKYKMYWTQVSELKKWKRATTIDRLYHVDWIPTMYLIDPQGKVVLGTVSIDRLRKYLRAISKPTLTTGQIAVMFPGGKEAFGKYMDDNHVTPMTVRRYKASGRVVCRFTVELDGKVNGAEVVRVEDFAIGNEKKFAKLDSAERQKVVERCTAEMEAEAVREINRMPDWKPTTKDGKPVQAQYFLPVVFSADKK